jgi:hypothetical protein
MPHSGRPCLLAQAKTMLFEAFEQARPKKRAVLPWCCPAGGSQSRPVTERTTVLNDFKCLLVLQERIELSTYPLPGTGALFPDVFCHFPQLYNQLILRLVLRPGRL